MSEEVSMKPGRIDRELIGEPITVGGRTIQPVARLSGWAGGTNGDAMRGVGGGAWLKVRPVEVIVREQDGSESRVPIVDPAAVALRGIVTSALVVAGVCTAVIAVRALVVALSARRR
jgi:uncharacterized spore protein YtfJ